jgi:glutaconate CoA-transferase, subunit A
MPSNQVPFVDIDALAGMVEDGATIAIPTALGDFGAASMVATRAIIRRGVRGLNIVCVPSSSMQADMLIGAGCVASIQAGGVLMYEYGPASRFGEAQRTGAIEVREASCPAIQAGLVAAEKGLPFMPVRGFIGSDILTARSGDWKVIENPFPPHDPIVVVPAIQPDVGLFHAPMVDRRGNVWVGRRSSLKLIAHAARCVLVTCERIYDGDFFDEPEKIPGTIPATYVAAVSHQPRGAWPYGFGTEYAEDVAHFRIYAEAARSQAGFDAYLREHVLGLSRAA